MFLRTVVLRPAGQHREKNAYCCNSGGSSLGHVFRQQIWAFLMIYMGLCLSELDFIFKSKYFVIAPKIILLADHFKEILCFLSGVKST